MCGKYFLFGFHLKVFEAYPTFSLPSISHLHKVSHIHFTKGFLRGRGVRPRRLITMIIDYYPPFYHHGSFVRAICTDMTKNYTFKIFFIWGFGWQLSLRRRRIVFRSLWSGFFRGIERIILFWKFILPRWVVKAIIMSMFERFFL